MKFRHKCISCGKEAHKKFRGRYFCTDCKRKYRRSKESRVLVEKHILSIGNVGIYIDVPVKLK